MADIRQVTGQFAVAPQLELDDFAGVAGMGFTRIINNRPDGESPDQPTSQEAEAAARAAGLSYVHAPFVGQPTPEAVKAVMGTRERTLAYCRSGTRSVTAWAFAQANNAAPADEIIQAAAAAGYNLAPLSHLLKQLGARE